MGGKIMIHFTDDSEKDTMFMGNISNLPQGKHGFHVHQKGDLGNQCKDAGGHYNPENKTHGDLGAQERHEGDFGNIVSDEDKTARVMITSKNTDLNKLIGRALVVHDKEDDLGLKGTEESKGTGSAGARLDCCIIDWQENKNSAPSLSFKKPSMGLFLDSQETLLVIKYPFRKAGTNISKQPTARGRAKKKAPKNLVYQKKVSESEPKTT